MKRTFRSLLAALVLLALLPTSALAQDFYGEGNVLIAVDMGPYAENEDVSYPEGTLGTLVWGPDAPTGENTRADFDPHPYTVPADVTPPQAPDYAIETTYTVGQRVFYPYLYLYEGEDAWFSADALPPEVFDDTGAPGFLIHRDRVKTENGAPQYLLPAREEDGEVYPSAAFLEIACVAVTEHSTVWQYTGTAYAPWPDFDPAIFIGAVELTEAELQFFIDTCDEAYTVQAQIYGDPRWQDMRGDRDGKAAYVALDLSVVYPVAAAFYSHVATDWSGFDCLVIGANRLPGRRTNVVWQEAEDDFTGMLIHELNHYIVFGCIGHEDERWSMWVGEAFAQAAVYYLQPESTFYLEYRPNVTDFSSRLRMIPGMLWGDEYNAEYPVFNYMAYALGPFFLRYIERETVGQADGRFWTNYFAQRTPEGSITGAELDAYLTETTGEGLDAWMAQFMAAVVVGAADGPYCMGEETITAEYRVDPFVFYRPYGEYGVGLSFDGGADEAIAEHLALTYELFGVKGGGTVYAWRNDAGGPIAVTGAEDRWRFFTADVDIPAEKPVIDIGSASELAKIGHDPAYPLSGRYRLTADIDLGGSEEAPWLPIGPDADPFTGVLDGNGHTVRGLFINTPGANHVGLFARIAGSAEVRDLTVCGSVTGGERVGGIAGYFNGGTIRGCRSLVTVAGTSKCGGIVGSCWYGTVEGCTAAGPVSGESEVGGIAGFADSGAIRGCYSTGNVTGAERVGGIAGQIQYNAVLEHCYSTGTVSGGAHTGGILGRAAYAAVENSYSYAPGLPAVGSVHADEDGETATVTGCYVRSDATGEGLLTAAEFAAQSSFDGWDFESVWSLENGVRPVLRSNPETVRNAAGHRVLRPLRF